MIRLVIIPFVVFICLAMCMSVLILMDAKQEQQRLHEECVLDNEGTYNTEEHCK